MVIAGIVAGGVGSRMGNVQTPKQFLEIGGKPIIIHTIEKFSASADIDYVVVGVHGDWQEYLEDILKSFVSDTEKIRITAGGVDRNDTIQRIIRKADEEWGIEDDTVFVTHDAVRPFVSQDIIKENVEAARKYGICGTVIAAVDTIVQSDNGEYITEMPPRSEMYQCQTPQSFKYGLFREVYSSMTKEELDTATDVCKLFYLRGFKVHMVRGSSMNFKITYPLDLKMAEFMLEMER